MSKEPHIELKITDDCKKDYLTRAGWTHRVVNDEDLWTNPNAFDCQDICFSDAVKLQVMIDKWGGEPHVSQSQKPLRSRE